MKVSEVFESIQGEGRYTGESVLFIRLSGCTRACSFCDTKYHSKGKEISVKTLTKRIKKIKAKTVVWTGGEPALQFKEITEVIVKTPEICHHLETNGDLIINYYYFNYVCFSPKELKVAKNVYTFCNTYLNQELYDIKIVTDLEKVNLDLVPFATTLMPLTTYDKEKDLEIKKRVWEYCLKNKLHYSPRLQVDLYDKKRGI